MGLNAKKGTKWCRARRGQKSFSQTLYNFVFFFCENPSTDRVFATNFFFRVRRFEQKQAKILKERLFYPNNAK